MQDFMRLYSGLVERCFNACTNDFTSKALTANEVGLLIFCSFSLLPYGGRSWLDADEVTNPQTTCVQNCTDKFLKHSERVGARFAEHNAGMSSVSHLVRLLSQLL